MRYFFFFLIIVLSISSCKKDADIISNNDAPYYGEIPTILLENYVNRIYIDLIGREPLDGEMQNDVQFLRDADVTIESRDALLYKLQFDTTFVEGALGVDEITVICNELYLTFPDAGVKCTDCIAAA